MSTNSTSDKPKEAIIDTKNNAEDYNPFLSSAPNVKSYQKPNIDENTIPDFIPEQALNRPKLDFEPSLDELSQTENANSNQRGQSKPQPENLNPALNDLSNKDKRIAAENMADTAIGGYVFICEKLLAPIAKIDQQKIEEKIATGEMSELITFPVDQSGNHANIRTYAQVYNGTVDETLKVEEDFKARVREPLIRICEKRGIALSDEQFVAIEFAKDLGMRGVMVYQLNKSTKMITNMVIEQTALMRSNTPQSYNAPISTQSAEPAPMQQEPTKEPVATPEIIRANPEVKKEVNSNFAPAQKLEGMPDFGNPSVLAHMEAASKDLDKKIVPSNNKKRQTKVIKPTK